MFAQGLGMVCMAEAARCAWVCRPSAGLEHDGSVRALCARGARLSRCGATAPTTRSARVCADVARRNGDAGTYGGKRCGEATAAGEEPGFVPFVFFVVRIEVVSGGRDVTPVLFGIERGLDMEGVPRKRKGVAYG